MAYNPDFQITPESDKHLYKDRGYPVFFYEKDEMAGKTSMGGRLLSWRDFMLRNPDRTAIDIQTWGEMEDKRVESLVVDGHQALRRSGRAPRVGTEKEPALHYERWESQSGLLPWVEFVKRNPERTTYAINKWDDLSRGSIN